MELVADIGGTKMRVAAVIGDRLGEIHKIATPSEVSAGVDALAGLARDCARGEIVSAFTGGIAADTIGEDGISGARNLPLWEHANLGTLLSGKLGAPVTLVNDVAAAGLGETFYGAGKGVLSLAYVTVSTGVGAAVIRDGAIVASGAETRMLVDGTDIEYLISGTAVRKKFGIEPQELSSLEEREKLADILAQGLATLLGKWPVPVIVLGGAMMVGVNSIPLSRVEETLGRLLESVRQRPTLALAQLGDDGGLWGGLALLRQHHVA